MIRLSTADSDFETRFTALVEAGRGTEADVSRDVAAIIADVHERGDAAVADFTVKFDGFDPASLDLEIAKEQGCMALDGLDPSLRDSLTLAASRIRAFHEKQKPEDSETIDADGIRMGSRWSAVETAGLYVPGGRAAYPSSLLMNAIPALVAGVENIVMVTPTPGGEINPLILAAAEIAGIHRIFRIGGAQAVAALAYGTDTIPRADVVVGPGNAWVAEAKRQLYGTVGIDMVAGPSEIVIIADHDNDPEWIAADLLSQAEHDPTSQSILFTDNASLADAVAETVDQQLAELATAETARASWDANGAIIQVDKLDDAVALSDRLAPEHLELAVSNPDALFAKVRHAGSVFLGRLTPEAIGDYVGGPNHVLPTGRRARFSSGLSVLDFMKRTSFLECGAEGLAAIGPAAVALADAEGLPAHAQSVTKRLSSGRK
ncbi:histidinol dehydrogenase [Parasphingopyxis sp. CP4]|uniref:histidinol dehydrogenase n=1 Tax=Parasphingopyxis sp. CP4 TaxID=2724527 RepID=UPI0015A386A4|nr:histidinol dehydrogenase [Parasphingopyxis sp. CP4]QLC22391.1 histidinol dehydrogenase [Parasphingopyxis sp. CP4]